MNREVDNRDRELVRQCLSGSKEAWDEFYQRFVSLVKKAICAQTRSKESDIQDLVQSVFLALFVSLKTYEHEFPLSKFVWIVSQRVCVDEYRKNTAAKRGKATVPLSHHNGDDDEAVMIRSGLVTQEQQLVDAEINELLRTAFHRLGDRCRELIRLRYLQEHSFKEIASLLGAKEKSLAVQAGRCLQDLKAHYLKVEQEGERP